MKKLFANTNRIPFVYDSCCNRNNKGIISMLILLFPSQAGQPWFSMRRYVKVPASCVRMSVYASQDISCGQLLGMQI